MLFMPSIVRDLPTMKAVHFPVFEVITPVTGVSFEVRGLTVAQESALYESAVSQQKYISMINQTLFECIENKVAPYDTLEGFEKNLTESDRYALMYGVLVSTYGDEIETTVVCRNCGKENKIKVKLSEYMTIEPYKGRENIFDKELEVVLPISKYKAVIKMPTLWDERQVNLLKNIDRDILTKMSLYTMVKKLIIPGSETKPDGSVVENNYVVDKTVEIYSVINNLPAKDNKTILKAWKDNFDKYKIDFKIDGNCSQCNTEFKQTINIGQELFRLLSEI